MQQENGVEQSWQRVLSEFANEATLVIDRAGHVIALNAKAQQMLESLGMDVDGLTMGVIAPYFETHGVEDLLQQISRSLVGVSAEASFRGVPDLSHRADFRFHRIPETTDPDLYAVLISDQSRQRVAEDRLNATRKSLEAQLLQAQKMEALGTLSSGIAHDFNNILASIIGASEVALDYMTEDEKARRYVQTVHRAGLRGKELIRQILSFARPSLDRSERVCLQDILLDCLSLLRPATTPTVQLDYGFIAENVWVMGDQSRLHQVFTNLMTNAVQALNGVGSVYIRLTRVNVGRADQPESHTPQKLVMRPGKYALVQIADTGPGIPKDVIDRIFDPFFTTKKAGEGTGLGLSVVLGIIQSHDGYIDVNCEDDSGTTFSVYLPIAMDVEQRQVVEVETPVMMGQGQRILLVDDETGLLDVGAATLALLQYQPECYRSPLDAIAAVRRAPEQYDGLITDYWMPEMDGAELARAMREMVPGLPILVVTGNAHLADVQDACGEVVDLVLSKPVTRESLSQALAQILP